MTTKFGTGVSGGGGGLLPTQAIIDDGQQITATNGQTILVAVADNVPSLTVMPFPMWQPFTVTCGSDGFGGFGYSAIEGEEFGSISNEPVDGYTLETCAVDGSGNFYFYLRGPAPMSDILWGADIGIDTASYVFGPFNGQAAPKARLDGDVVSEAELSGVTAWTLDQQVPIVIIPQNGG